MSFKLLALAALISVTPVCAQTAPKLQTARIPLPSSKTLGPVPGKPRPVASFPVSAVLSPDGRYLALLDDGYGRREHGIRQGIAVFDLRTDQLEFFPDARLGRRAAQTYFLGLAFRPDGKRLYASMASVSDPNGAKKGNTGNGVAVYSFADGRIASERFISIAPQPLAHGKRAAKISSKAPKGTAVPFPAGLAAFSSGQGDRLLVANNLADNALLLDADSGRVLHRFDLSTGAIVPAAFPYAVIVSRDGKRAWCSLWNASRVAELDLSAGKVKRWIPLLEPKSKTAAGSHPTALLLSPDESLLYVALSNADRIAVVDAARGRLLHTLDTRLKGQRYGGAYPNALAQTADGKTLLVANASTDSVAVFHVSRDSAQQATAAQAPIGFIPTQWYPTALAVQGDDLFIVSAKSTGTGPNSQVVEVTNGESRGPHPYIATLLHGSLARVNLPAAMRDLESLTAEVLESNLMNGRSGAIRFHNGSMCAEAGAAPANSRCPIQHVLYVIKENRTYDQVLGDLGVGDGDRSLTLYGEEVTPNQHRLARQFGVLDNFYVSGEVSGNGHVWSTAAITSDYTEKTWQIAYRGSERTYDYEGQVTEEFPLDEGYPDVNEPGTGYLWTNLARHGKTYRHYGEYITTTWCDEPQWVSPTESGTPSSGQPAGCTRKFVKPGEPLPPTVGDPKGGPSPWPWPVPMLAQNRATKPELRGHFHPGYADFRMEYPDQLRADEFLNEFSQWTQARAAGKGDPMPQFILLRLPNDHTIGTRPGYCAPAACVADNDLALGRVVDAISHSPYWDDTAIFVLEDDAQDGADHVDAHRSVAFVISRYSPRGPGADGQAAAPFVDHRFYTSVNMIRTMEVLLGLPPMNNNDAQAAVMAPLFSGGGDQPPFTADHRNRDNGLIYRVNPPRSPGAKASSRMNFKTADSADTEVLNRILWREAKGGVPMPAPRYNILPKEREDRSRRPD